MTDLFPPDRFPPATEADWRALAEKSLKGKDLETALTWVSDDGIPLFALGHDRAAGAKDTLPSWRQGESWAICQRLAAPDLAALMEMIRAEAAGGVAEVILPLAAPGLPGTPVPDFSALAAALQELSDTSVNCHLEPGEHLSALLAWQDTARVTFPQSPDGPQTKILADPLGSLARAGGTDTPLETQYAALVPHLKIGGGEGPEIILLADGRPAHEAGGSEAQELALALAAAVTHVRAMAAADIPAAQTLRHMWVALAADADVFSTLVKFRVARRLFHRLGEALGPEAAQVAASLPFHGETSWRSLTRLDPHNNILRATLGCAGAVFGGADRITTLAFTWPLGLPDAHARRIARNVQHVLAKESHLGHVEDPARGSPYVAQFSQALAEKAWQIFQDIERAGGLAEALLAGKFQAQVADVAERRQADFEREKRHITGVTRYATDDQPEVSVAPWPTLPDLAAPVFTIPPLAPRNLAAPFEKAIRERQEAAS